MKKLFATSEKVGIFATDYDKFLEKLSKGKQSEITKRRII